MLRVRLLAPLALALALVLASACPAAAAPVRPERTGSVVDVADVLSFGERDGIVDALAGLRSRTGVDVALVTVPTTDGEPIEAFAAAVFTAWEVGGPSRNGVLFAIAENDRKVRIEVGESARAALSPGRAQRILDDDVLPRFSSRSIPSGIRAGLQAISTAVGGGDLALPEVGDLDGGGSGSGSGSDSGISTGAVVGLGALVVGGLFLVTRRFGRRSGGSGGTAHRAYDSSSSSGTAAGYSYDSSSSASSSDTSSSSDSSGASGSW